MTKQTLTLTDSAGRSLVCDVKHSLDLADQTYVLLLPVDAPVEIFAWQEDEENEESETPILVDREAEIEQVFPIAKAVLAEQNLTLKRSAVVLTVEGELPDFEEEEDFDEEDDGAGQNENGRVIHDREDEDDLDGDEEDEDSEEFELLARFYHEEQEYGIYTPIDPLFILARLDDEGQPHLLSPEELEKLEPFLPELERQIEDQLFDVFEN